MIAIRFVLKMRSSFSIPKLGQLSIRGSRLLRLNIGIKGFKASRKREEQHFDGTRERMFDAKKSNDADRVNLAIVKL
jgi:hypothetical protein